VNALPSFREQLGDSGQLNANDDGGHQIGDGDPPRKSPQDEHVASLVTEEPLFLRIDDDGVVIPLHSQMDRAIQWDTCIARGRCGEVYKIRWNGHDVALKIFSDNQEDWYA